MYLCIKLTIAITSFHLALTLIIYTITPLFVFSTPPKINLFSSLQSQLLQIELVFNNLNQKDALCIVPHQLVMLP